MNSNNFINCFPSPKGDLIILLYQNCITPKPDEDEIIFKKKEDIHDSEGFIFTPKKVIEDSKKIMKNLKNLDI